MKPEDALNLSDFEVEAQRVLPKLAYDYYASGAHDEVTLRENHRAYERIALRYRVLVDVSKRDSSTTVLGQKVAMPILVAPTAFHKLAASQGELATARAAAAAQSIMILSTLSNTAVEEVVSASSGPVWFQLYIYKDRGATQALVQRAERAGCRALVLTVDAPRLGTRERDVRNQFCLPPELAVENLTAAGMAELPDELRTSGLAAYFEKMIDPALTFDDIAWLASITRLPIVVKGVVRGDDAARAVEHGAKAVVVSNHGGRQLDTAPATITVLPEIAEALDERAELLIDGGIRRGTDVLKALALGAQAVLLGRPVLWGLAAAGEAGVRRVLTIMEEELDLAMALCGCCRISDISSDLVRL